ncbi:MAG: flavodoxin [Eubacteriales bacterium]
MSELLKNIFPRFSILFCAIAIVLVSLSACNTGNSTVPDITPDTDRPTNTESKTLVVYFSMPDNVDNSTVVIDGQTLGNTQYMAYVIQENTGANIFRIVPETPYPTDHDALVDLARDEQRNGARPAFVGEIENFDEYDTVFVGYPNWWSDMPMILYTFFDTYDFSGKTIIPFNTHGGSGFSNTISTIRRLEPDAEVLNGLSISRNHIQDAEGEIAEWVRSLGFEKNS